MAKKSLLEGILLLSETRSVSKYVHAQLCNYSRNISLMAESNTQSSHSSIQILLMPVVSWQKFVKRDEKSLDSQCN